MKLLQQILAEAGGDTAKAFTIIPNFGAYFKGVKSVNEYTPQKIILNVGKIKVEIRGEHLEIGKYFQGDLFVKGDVRGTEIE
jgi:hypothetical protein